jgi:hypothetical protein
VNFFSATSVFSVSLVVIVVFLVVNPETFKNTEVEERRIFSGCPVESEGGVNVKKGKPLTSLPIPDGIT